MPFYTVVAIVFAHEDGGRQVRNREAGHAGEAGAEVALEAGPSERSPEACADTSEKDPFSGRQGLRQRDDEDVSLCVFITAVPITKLLLCSNAAW